MTKLKKILAPLVVGLALGTAIPASAAELVTNGGFETGNFSGWTTGGNFTISSVNAAAANTGNWGASLGPIGSPGTLSQTLSTVIGQLYTISFDLRNDGGTPNFFEVLFDGNSIFSTTNASPFAYATNSFSAAATSASTALQIRFRQDPSFWDLDNVSVQELSSAVPEPGTWALLLFGFGIAGMAMRSRSRRVTAKVSFV